VSDPSFTGLLMTFSDPVPGREADYDYWYQNVHLPQVCAIPGVSSAQRFRLVDTGSGAASGPGNVAVYRLDGDPAAVSAEITARARGGKLDMTDAIDQASVSVRLWTAHGETVGG
jgi:hypothetical protein